jgi:hypothetical protein
MYLKSVGKITIFFSNNKDCMGSTIAAIPFEEHATKPDLFWCSKPQGSQI